MCQKVNQSQSILQTIKCSCFEIKSFPKSSPSAIWQIVSDKYLFESNARNRTFWKILNAVICYIPVTLNISFSSQKKETPTQVFCRENYDIFKSNIFYRIPPVLLLPSWLNLMISQTFSVYKHSSWNYWIHQTYCVNFNSKNLHEPESVKGW